MPFPIVGLALLGGTGAGAYGVYRGASEGARKALLLAAIGGGVYLIYKRGR